MLGFVFAVIGELKTNQSVWSQLTGKTVDGEVVQQAHGIVRALSCSLLYICQSLCLPGPA